MGVKYEDLSPKDQELLNTDFGDEIEKQAAEKVAMAQDLYAAGFQKLAAESADEMDEADKEEKKEEESKPEKKLDEEEKKEASARGAFIAKGYIDGLKKLGSDRHGDENHYLYPFLAEKLANAGAAPGKVMSFLNKLKAKGGDMAGKAKGMAGQGKEKALASAKKVKEHVGKNRGAYGFGAGAAGGVAAGRASKGE